MTEFDPRHEGGGESLLTGFISKTEMAREFGVSERTVERWVRLRLLPRPLKMGRSILFHRQTLEAHLLARAEDANAPKPRRCGRARR